MSESTFISHYSTPNDDLSLIGDIFDFDSSKLALCNQFSILSEVVVDDSLLKDQS